ncbi:hypothetical protein J1N35_016280 [Gossypium stocksii]|uniref:Uncharacterized protein n=1 Tax=Gossypium stocksii TaxID=47602 RepID=A0A9D3VLR5_9ROSI|nr:hypothetical protein J1N35_016280 [Gossypium stocksii]
MDEIKREKLERWKTVKLVKARRKFVLITAIWGRIRFFVTDAQRNAKRLCRFCFWDFWNPLLHKGYPDSLLSDIGISRLSLFKSPFFSIIEISLSSIHSFPISSPIHPFRSLYSLSLPFLSFRNKP